ncbi:hypothetical protein EIKCOROL_01640 [Eikenella corrodens ATCC 23834]|uniref:Uncharacterized protein n=1 Tax=Eikenella corrodens ATCC 23834 TaxID=546274 RepID=C0DW90_EIKCO|nr:hypothetical protein EIKCOROL_01640 [Eikenella corrodens ATCC 23834]
MERIDSAEKRGYLKSSGSLFPLGSKHRSNTGIRQTCTAVIITRYHHT